MTWWNQIPDPEAVARELKITKTVTAIIRHVLGGEPLTQLQAEWLCKELANGSYGAELPQDLAAAMGFDHPLSLRAAGEIIARRAAASDERVKS